MALYTKSYCHQCLVVWAFLHQYCAPLEHCMKNSTGTMTFSNHPNVRIYTNKYIQINAHIDSVKNRERERERAKTIEILGTFLIFTSKIGI